VNQDKYGGTSQLEITPKWLVPHMFTVPIYFPGAFSIKMEYLLFIDLPGVEPIGLMYSGR